MLRIARYVHEAGFVSVEELQADALGVGFDRVVSPAEVSSAGRVRIQHGNAHPVEISLIFSVSAPYDVMVNAEFQVDCDESSYLASCFGVMRRG